MALLCIFRHFWNAAETFFISAKLDKSFAALQKYFVERKTSYRFVEKYFNFIFTFTQCCQLNFVQNRGGWRFFAKKRRFIATTLVLLHFYVVMNW